MPPTVALLVWFIFLLALLIFDPAKDSRTSIALWVPLTWMFIVASRLPAQWVAGESAAVGTVQNVEEGNSLDRTVFFILIFLAIGILISRSFKWGQFFANNRALVAFVLFALVSVLWSDFHFVSFKRWFRDLGNYLVILVVLSDAFPLEAVRTVFRRLCYLLIPLSFLLIKYYPGISRQYDPWTGVYTDGGATTSKNMLGLLCLVSGIFFSWDTITRWSDRKERRTKQIIRVNAILMAMTLWLLYIANSATSRVCLLIGCVVIVAAHSKWAKTSATTLKLLIPSIFSLYVIFAFGLNLNGQFAEAVGRNPNLTDRTAIWKVVLSVHINPLLGTGYQSFWLGQRVQYIWKYFPGINESHNGYIDTYLNLGIIGLFLLIGFLLASYSTIWKQIRSSSVIASLSLAIWTVLLFYNVTEAAFGGGLLWLVVLLGGLTVPEMASAHRTGTPSKIPKLVPAAPYPTFSSAPYHARK